MKITFFTALTFTVATAGGVLSGVANAGENPFSASTRNYASAGVEYFKWDETVDNLDRKYVQEHGPRFRVNTGANNYVDARQGTLKGWEMSLMAGAVSYRGGALDPKYNLPPGSLKGETWYTGYSADMTRGYRMRASESVSFDLKGSLGAQAWLRNIRSDDVYVASEQRTRRFGAVEVSLQPYAKAGAGVNWQMTPASQVSLEGGALYPIKTWTHSNAGDVWLQPKSRLSPYAALTWNVTRDVFVKAYYVHQKYGKSDTERGMLGDKAMNFYQPATTTSSAGLEFGFYY
jgi:hypothetical protein